jgi:hypothetical protein
MISSAFSVRRFRSQHDEKGSSEPNDQPADDEPNGIDSCAVYYVSIFARRIKQGPVTERRLFVLTRHLAGRPYVHHGFPWRDKTEDRAQGETYG